MSNSFINGSLSKNEKVLHTYQLHWIVWLKIVIYVLIGLATLKVMIGAIFLISALFSALGVIGTVENFKNNRNILIEKIS